MFHLFLPLFLATTEKQDLTSARTQKVFYTFFKKNRSITLIN